MLISLVISQGMRLMTETFLSDVFLWPNGDWCYRADTSIRAMHSDDYQVIGFGTCAFNSLFEEFHGDGVAYLANTERAA